MCTNDADIPALQREDDAVLALSLSVGETPPVIALRVLPEEFPRKSRDGSRTRTDVPH